MRCKSRLCAMPISPDSSGPSPGPSPGSITAVKTVVPVDNAGNSISLVGTSNVNIYLIKANNIVNCLVPYFELLTPDAPTAINFSSIFTDVFGLSSVVQRFIATYSYAYPRVGTGNPIVGQAIIANQPGVEGNLILLDSMGENFPPNTDIVFFAFNITFYVPDE